MVGGTMMRLSRKCWSVSAVVGIVIGTLVLLAGERSGHTGLRLVGAIIMAAGAVCAVVGLTRDSAGGRGRYK
jgi:hypothetical protein